MINRKNLFLGVFLLLLLKSLCALSLAEQFKQLGYVEICDTHHASSAYDSLYACFDECIKFLQTNPVWAQKLRIAKERFIRSKDRNYYSTDFFGFYDESAPGARGQISFYYSIHFHEFINAYFQELSKVPHIARFLNVCFEMQKPYGKIFNQAACELGLETLFSSAYGAPPLLLKVMKYLPSYVATKPHYDGTTFSLFLDSTDHQSLLLSQYKFSLTVDDFSSPIRTFSRCDDKNSILLIPGTLLTEYFINPTPHIVLQSGKVRYATIAFAMRPDYVLRKNEFSRLPTFNY